MQNARHQRILEYISANELVSVAEPVAYCCQEEIESVNACGEFGAKEDACVEGLCLREVVLAEDESDIAARFGCEAAGRPRGMISHLLDNVEDALARFLAHVPAIVDHE